MAYFRPPIPLCIQLPSIVIANMRASVLLIALLGVGLARAETATTLAVDLALDQSAAPNKAGGCARGFPVPAELRWELS